MNQKYTIIATIICTASLFMLAFLLTRKPEIIVDKPTNIDKYQRTIDSLDQIILVNITKLNEYQRNIDSLNSLPPKIIIKYREKKAILPTATVAQLDSIIRANTGL